MSDQKPYKPKLQFLRDLLPNDMPEVEIQAEEARLMRYIALVQRIAIRRQKEAEQPSIDSPNHEEDSMM